MNEQRRRRSNARRVAALSLLCCAALPATAAAREELTGPSQYEFKLEPTAWFVRLGGTSKLGVSPAAEPLDLATGFNMDASEAAPSLQLAMRRNDLWELSLSGADFSTDRTGTFTGSGVFGDIVLADGGLFRSSFDLTTVGMEFTYWAHHPCRFEVYEDGRQCRLDLRLGPQVAMRYVDVGHIVEAPGQGREEAGGEWIGAMIGGRVQMRFNVPESVGLIHQLQIDGNMAIGPALGGDGGWMAQISAGMTLHLSHNLGLTFGYRLLELDVQRNDYEFSGGLQGLFIGVAVRF